MSNQNKYECINELTIVMPDGSSGQYDVGREFDYSAISKLGNETINKHFKMKPTNPTPAEIKKIKADKEKLIKSQQTVTK